VVKALIISDGDSDRVNRENIFNPAHTVVGIYSGTHTSADKVATTGHQACVLYAVDYTETVTPPPPPTEDVDDTTTVLKESEYRTLDT
jgi:hypothetical protein